jgi:hypothetical protein
MLNIFLAQANFLSNLLYFCSQRILAHTITLIILKMEIIAQEIATLEKQLGEQQQLKQNNAQLLAQKNTTAPTAAH